MIKTKIARLWLLGLVKRRIAVPLSHLAGFVTRSFKVLSNCFFTVPHVNEVTLVWDRLTRAGDPVIDTRSIWASTRE